MKIILLSLLLGFSVYTSKAQSKVVRPDTTKMIYNPENYSTDSVKRGNELYQGGKGQKTKSQGDTLRGSKNRSGTKRLDKSNQRDSKNKKSHSGVTPHKRIVLAMNDL